MATPDEDWSKAVAEEVLGEENATNEDVDAFHESDKSLILDKVLTPTESFTLDGDDEYVVEVEPVPLDA